MKDCRLTMYLQLFEGGFIAIVLYDHALAFYKLGSHGII